MNDNYTTDVTDGIYVLESLGDKWKVFNAVF